MHPKGRDMTDWVILQQFLRTKERSLKSLFDLVPSAKRVKVAKAMKEKTYDSAIRYALREHFPAWPDVVIEDFGGSLIRDYNAVRNARRTVQRVGKADYNPVQKHWDESLETIRRAFRTARPAGAAVECAMTRGKTHKIDSVMSVGRPIFNIALSPAYKRTTDRIGTTTYKNYVILSGFLVLEPFEDARVWCCEVEEAKERKHKTIYLGRHDEDFVAHTNLAACITNLEKVVTKKCIAAMRGEVED
jgi:hypothetical protein